MLGFSFDQPIRYAAQHPIIHVPGSPLLVVGSAAVDWRARQDGSDMGELSSVEVHYDGDDPNHIFVDPADWPEIPAAIIDRYNQPFRKASRIAMRRAINTAPFEVMAGHYHANAWMRVVEAGRKSGGNVLVAAAGGIVRNDEQEPQCGDRETDAAMMAAIDCWRARRDRRWRHADVNRDAIVASGFEPMVGRDGAITFVAAGE